MSKPILCLDFDGTLHSYFSGWSKVDRVRDPPTDGAKAFLEEAVKHFEVHVHSSKSHQHGGIDAMIRWCTEHFGYQITNQMYFPDHKPPATVSLDDRAVRFEGVWPDPQDLLALRPWYVEARKGRKP